MLTLTSFTIMAPAPRELARFYAVLLGGEITQVESPRAEEPASAGWAQVRTSTVRLNFEYEAAWTAPKWPAEAGQQTATQHLDIQVDDLAAATEYAVSCGARFAEFQPQDDVRVLFDPAGHPFCLFT